MKTTKLTSWHFALVLAAVVFLTGRNSPSAPQAEAPVSTWQVYFSPHGGATLAIVSVIDQARESVWVQACSFASELIAEALIRAQERGVKVQAILDKSQRTQK